MGPEDARRVVSQLRSGLSGPIAAAINALTVISADATDPMSTQDWPGLAGALCEVVRGGLEFDAGRGGTPGWAAAGECLANPGYMLSNCARSCDSCDRASSAPADGAASAAAGGLSV